MEWGSNRRRKYVRIQKGLPVTRTVGHKKGITVEFVSKLLSEVISLSLNLEKGLIELRVSKDIIGGLTDAITYLNDSLSNLKVKRFAESKNYLDEASLCLSSVQSNTKHEILNLLSDKRVQDYNRIENLLENIQEKLKQVKTYVSDLEF